MHQYVHLLYLCRVFQKRSMMKKKSESTHLIPFWKKNHVILDDTNLGWRSCANGGARNRRIVVDVRHCCFRLLLWNSVRRLRSSMSLVTLVVVAMSAFLSIVVSFIAAAALVSIVVSFSVKSV